MNDTKTIKEMAIAAYDAYTAAVGGVNYEGKPLPSGKEFFADDSKSTQQAGWIAAVEATKKDVFDLANNLPQKEHGDLCKALVLFHLAKWGKDELPVKVRNWLDRHGWVWTVIVALMALAATFFLNSCTYTSSQVGADGSTANRVFAVDASTARDLVKLYGFQQIPVVNVGK